eukprot:6187469-Amphidinium_carterae.2
MGLVKGKPILRLNLQDLAGSTSKAVGARWEIPEQAWQFLQLHRGKQWWTKQMCEMRNEEEPEQDEVECDKDEDEEHDEIVVEEQDEVVVADDMPAQETEAAPQWLVCGQPTKAEN